MDEVENDKAVFCNSKTIVIRKWYRELSWLWTNTIISILTGGARRSSLNPQVHRIRAEEFAEKQNGLLHNQKPCKHSVPGVPPLFTQSAVYHSNTTMQVLTQSFRCSSRTFV